MANEAPSQDLSLGAEYRVLDGLALRKGFRQDQTTCAKTPILPVLAILKAQT